jgi:alkyl hydroperoxide reductase subunit AhpF
MVAALDARDPNGIREHLKGLEKPVRLLFFTQRQASDACAEQGELLQSLVTLSDKLVLDTKEFTAGGPDGKRYGIDKVPATIVAADKDHGIRFYGVTGGYEFGSLLEAIRMVSTGKSGLGPDIEEIARGIAAPLHLEIMVTLTCPYCPRMVRLRISSRL